MLSKTVIHVPFQRGVDTNSDKRAQDPLSMAVAENVTFDHDGALRKRCGQVTISSTSVNASGTLTAISASAGVGVRDDELVLFDGDRVHTYVPSNASASWADRGRLTSCAASTRIINTDSYNKAYADSCRVGDLTFHGWYNTALSSAYYTVTDEQTGAKLVADKALHTGTLNGMQAIAFSNRACFLMADNTRGLTLSVVNPATPTTVDTSFLWRAASNSNSGMLFDGCVTSPSSSANTRLFLAIASPSTGTVKNGQLVLGSVSSSFTASWIGPRPQLCLGPVCCFSGASGNGQPSHVWVVGTFNGGTSGSLAALTADPVNSGSVAGTLVTVDNDGGFDFDRAGIGGGVWWLSGALSPLTSLVQSVGGVWNPSGSGLAEVYYTVTGSSALSAVASSTPYRISDTWAMQTFRAGLRWTNELTGTAALVVNPKAIVEAGSNLAFPWLDSCQLVTKPFVHRGRTYASVVVDSDAQSCFYTVADDRTLVAKHLQNRAWGPRTLSPMSTGSTTTNFNIQAAFGSNTTMQLANVSQVSSSSFSWSTERRGELIDFTAQVGAGLSARAIEAKSISVSSVDFDHPSAYDSTKLGGSLHAVGGVLKSYDGKQVSEHGFNFYPEAWYVRPVTFSPGPLSGTYRYRACYEWTDDRDQLHRSAPSLEQSTTPASNQKVQFIYTRTCFTSKPGVRFVLYRTVSSLSGSSDVFYRVTDALNPSIVNRDVRTLAHFDGLPDSVLITHDPLYTVGGELDNLPPPSCTSVCSYRNRLWLAGLADEPDSIEFSKTRSGLDPVEFAGLRVKVGDDGKPVVAIQALDGNLYIFKENSVYTLAGDGPDNTGDGSDYGEPVQVTSECGCSNPASLALTPQGLLFESLKGTYLLPRGAQDPVWIGRAVSAFDSQRVTSAVADPLSNRVIIGCFTGSSLVYDTNAQQWATWTQPEGGSADAAVWRNQRVTLGTNGTCLIERSGSLNDLTSQQVPLTVTTAWLTPQDIADGFNRLWRLWIIGEVTSGSPTLTVRLAYDWNETVAETRSIAASQLLVSSGDTTVIGGIRPGRQKFRAIKVSITDSGSPAGSGVSLVGLALSVGTRGKSSETKRF